MNELSQMTSEEIIESRLKVSRWEAYEEIKHKHGACWFEFQDEFGFHQEYKAADVLIWLGY